MGETAKQVYQSMETIRAPYLQMAYEAALVTIPEAFPYATDAPQGKVKEIKKRANQEIGPRGVNNLGEKIHLSILPPNLPAMKYEPDPEAKAQTDGETLDQIYKQLGVRENVLQASIDAANYRPALRPIGIQLTVSGNILILHREGKIRTFRLDRYVVARDHEGLPHEIVVREDLTYRSLPDHIKAIVDTHEDKQDGRAGDLFRPIEVFTWIRREGDQYIEHQEVMGQVIPESQGSSPVDRPSWIPATMYLEDGDDYGTGHVTLYQGAMDALDRLSLSVRQYSVLASKVLPMVDPTGLTKLRDINEAENGQGIPGRDEDVTLLSLDKNADMAIVASQIADLKEGMSFAFLLNSAVRRNAERVTAEEIREIAQELDTTLGGFYSTLTEQVQLPLILGHERWLEQAGKLPALPKDLVQPVVMTGLESIGRGQDAMNLALFGNDLTIWTPVVQSLLGEGIKQQALIDRLATARSVKTDGLFLSEEELAEKRQQEQQAAQQQALAEKAAGPAVTAMGNMAAEGADLPQ